MSSRCPNPRTLVGVICAAVTAVLWALCFWQLFLRFAPDTTPPTKPPCFCQNNGICPDGPCVCPDEWIGSHCEIVNYCDSSTALDNSSQDILNFERIIVGRYGYSMETCANHTVNGGISRATRMCTRKNGMPTLEHPRVVNCSLSLTVLSEQVQHVNKNSTNEIVSIAVNMQILTSRPEELTTQDISTAASVAENILNLSNSTLVPVQAAASAVSTVSQLLNANKSEFTNSNLTSVSSSLTMAMQHFSVSDSSTQEVVQPNIAVRTVALQKDTPTTVLFSALKGSTNGFVSDRIIVDKHVTGLKTDDGTEIQMLMNVTNTNSTGTDRVGFVLYQNDRLFPSKVHKSQLEEHYSNLIISGNVNRTMVNSIKIALSPQYNRSKLQLHSHACVFWDYSQNEWNTRGCQKETDSRELLKCSCNHTTNFAVLMSFTINYKYAKPLEILSYIGCGLSIAGLAITILFQILIRKTRKTSSTMMLVSLCSSMLIFNIIFLSGIENSNAVNKRSNIISSTNTLLRSHLEKPPENAWCTAAAVLLHFFLLATFMWTALNSVQLYLLLVKAERHLSSRYNIIMMVTGWGAPAVVVLITFGATYSKANYRQEEFCWLAALDSMSGNFSTEKPMLWAFLLPTAAVLLFNIGIFVKIMVSVMWKENKNLTSTKKKSFMMKILGTFSVAVLLGITWALGYLMLIDHEQANIVFSYAFCILNATQGFQIFVLHTLRSPIFKQKVTDIFAVFALPKIRIYFHSKTYFLFNMLHKKDVYESFKLSDSMGHSDDLSTGSSTMETWQK